MLQVQSISKITLFRIICYASEMDMVAAVSSSTLIIFLGKITCLRTLNSHSYL
jgi:hypothetical protein